MALRKSANHTKAIAQSMKEIPDHLAAMAIGMFARKIREMDFETALSGSGHLRVDDDQLDAIHALAAVGCEFFTKHPHAKRQLLDTLPSLGKWLQLALDALRDGSFPRSTRLRILNAVEDTISALRDIGNDGRLYMRQHGHWRRIILTWLAVEDSSIEEDTLLSGLLGTSRGIFREERGSGANFPDEVIMLGSGEDKETKAKNVIRTALGRIRRAMSAFMINGEDSVLALHLGVFHFLLLTETSENEARASEHPLHVALDELGGMGVIKEIMKLGLGHSKWTTVSLGLGIIFCHLNDIRSSNMLKKSLDIGLVELLWEASKTPDRLTEIGLASMAALVREFLPEALILRSVVKGCSLDGLRSSFADNIDDQWSNILTLYEDRKDLYKTLVRRNGKESIPCANVSRLVRRQ